MKWSQKNIHQLKVCRRLRSTWIWINHHQSFQWFIWISIFEKCYSVDPCAKIHCGAGRVCEATGSTASCVCIPECPQQSDPRRMVCTNRNETWNSDCEVYRERCLCDTDDERCKSAELKHIHIDYYGECKEMPVNRIPNLRLDPLILYLLAKTRLIIFP